MTDFSAVGSRGHREAAARLASEGWNVCGIGDWATVWRSPEGRRAARVSPFEPAYEVFVALCRNLEGHPMLPRIDFDAPLEGGGRLTVMEFLRPAAPAEAGAAKQRWAEAAPGDSVTAVRREAERLDAEAASSIPYWGGLDHNPHNVMTGLDGELKFVDLFYVNGPELYGLLREDPHAIAERIPAERRRHITEIGAVARLSTPEEIAALRRGAAAIG
jgi:hypothetical protein